MWSLILLQYTSIAVVSGFQTEAMCLRASNVSKAQTSLIAWCVQVKK